MANPYRELTEAELQILLVKEIKEHGPGLIDSTYESLQSQAVTYLTRTVGADSHDLFTYVREATMYMNQAHLIQRADELSMNLARLIPESMLGESNPRVTMEELTRNSRKALYRRGERVYVSTMLPADETGGGCEYPAYMEVIITGVEEEYDSVRYQIGIPTPDGQSVDITDEWQDEEDFHRDLPALETPPRDAKPRPHLKIVK